jgi:membrane-bound lytic murein transglycosylase B
MSSMKFSCTILVALPLLTLAAAAQAQPAPTAVAPAASAAAATSSQKRVTEDSAVRIEETRVRGQVQRVQVHSKLLGTDYEITVPPAGRDPSQDKGAAGKRTWSLFDF